jgi:hypothetical protein
MVRRIHYRHLKQLVRTAAALPGRKLDVALWQRLEPWNRALAGEEGAGGAAPPDELPAETRKEVARLRVLVAGCLSALAGRAEEVLGPALARARTSWDTVDDLVIVDGALAATLTAAGKQLEAAASQDGPVAAAAMEGLLALEAARGITSLAERRLSALIRLRVRSPQGELLPGGRPFLDLGAALAEAARAWG